MPWFVGQNRLGSHRVGFVADQALIDEVSARAVVVRRRVRAAAAAGDAALRREWAGAQMVRWRLQLPSLDIGLSHTVRR